MTRGPYAEIDLGSIRHNIEVLTQKVAPAALMVVVKANAYGHGLEPVSECAAAMGVPWIGVHDVASGLILRRNQKLSHTRLFAWQIPAREGLAAAIDAGIDIGVSTRGELDAVAAAQLDRPARVHLKIDTGLHRAGAREEDWPELLRAAMILAPRVEVVGLWSHLAETSDEEDDIAIALFERGVATAETLGIRGVTRHIAPSNPAFAQPHSRFELVRIGSFTYGIPPGGGIAPHTLGLRPSFTLSAPVIELSEDSATIGIGYGHGIPTAVAGTVEVTIRGRRYLIEEVAAEYLRVRGVRDAELGDRAYLFGAGEHGEAAVHEWADRLETISEEFVVRLSPAIPRLYTGSQGQGHID